MKHIQKITSDAVSYPTVIWEDSTTSKTQSSESDIDFTLSNVMSVQFLIHYTLTSTCIIMAHALTHRNTYNLIAELIKSLFDEQSCTSTPFVCIPNASHILMDV